MAVLGTKVESEGGAEIFVGRHEDHPEFIFIGLRSDTLGVIRIRMRMRGVEALRFLFKSFENGRLKKDKFYVPQPHLWWPVYEPPLKEMSRSLIDLLHSAKPLCELDDSIAVLGTAS